MMVRENVAAGGYENASAVTEAEADLQGAGDAVLDVLQQDVVGLVTRQPPEPLELAQVPAPPGELKPEMSERDKKCIHPLHMCYAQRMIYPAAAAQATSSRAR
jgi:hypothetical protein